MQPGCITQLMTAMVVIDNMYNDNELSNTVDITKKLSQYGDTFALGESISVEDLLKAMLVGGDEQAAEALASYSASKRSIFVNEMNAKCMELGLMDTQFRNPSGAYSTKQYSTAADLAVITQSAMRYRTIADMLELESVGIDVESRADSRVLEIASSDPLLTGANAYKYISGGIMGTMSEPAYSTQFAAVAVKDDMQLIAIMMDADAGVAAADAKALIEYADTKVTRNTIVKKDKLIGHVCVKGGAVTRAAAYTETKGFAYVPPEGSDELVQTQAVLMSGLEAPLKAGDKVGEFRIYVADELKGTVDLVVKEDIPVGWPLSKIYISNRVTIAIGVIVLIVIAFILRVENVKRQRIRRREAMRRQKIRELARKQLEIDEDRRMRNWSGNGYSEMPPRTTDLRRETKSGIKKEDMNR